MQTIGYHTVEDRGNVDHVEQNAPFLCRSEKAWLGHGYYFWDDDFDRAHNWGKSHCGGRYMICKADLDINDSSLLDLCTREGKKVLRELIDVLISDFRSGYGNKQLTVGQTISHLRRISQWPQYRRIFPYVTIKAEDYPTDTMIKYAPESNEEMSLNPRVQICLFEKSSSVLRSFCVIFPEEYIQD